MHGLGEGNSLSFDSGILALGYGSGDRELVSIAVRMIWYLECFAVMEL